MTTETTADTPAKPARRPRKPATPKASAAAAPKAAKNRALPAKAADSPSGSESLLSQAQDTVRKAANTGKDRATDALGDVAQLIEEVAKTIDEQLGGNYGSYARKASGTINSVAENLRAKDIDELLDDARALIRKQPAVAIGAAAALGFVLTRLVKAGQDDDA